MVLGGYTDSYSKPTKIARVLNGNGNYREANFILPKPIDPEQSYLSFFIPTSVKGKIYMVGGALDHRFHGKTILRVDGCRITKLSVQLGIDVGWSSSTVMLKNGDKGPTLTLNCLILTVLFSSTYLF